MKNPTKITCNSLQLFEAAQTLCKVAGKNNALPITDSLLLTAHPQMAEIELRATNSRLHLTASIDVAFASKNIPHFFCLIEANLLRKALEYLPEQSITLSFDESKVEIIFEDGKLNLSQQFNHADFPQFKLNERWLTDISALALNKTIDKVIYAVADYDLSHVISCLLIEAAPNNLRFVGTDGRMMVVHDLLEENRDRHERQFLLKKAHVLTLKSILLANKNKKAKIQFDTKSICVCVGMYSLSIPLVKDAYPDYKKAIPNTYPNTLSINRQYLTQLVSRIEALAHVGQPHEIQPVIFNLSELENSVQNYPNQEAHVKINIMGAQYTGAPIQIGFNGKLLLAHLSKLKADEIKIFLNTPRTAALFVENPQDEAAKTEAIIMPTITTNHQENGEQKNP